MRTTNVRCKDCKVYSKRYETSPSFWRILLSQLALRNLPWPLAGRCLVLGGIPPQNRVVTTHNQSSSTYHFGLTDVAGGYDGTARYLAEDRGL